MIWLIIACVAAILAIAIFTVSCFTQDERGIIASASMTVVFILSIVIGAII